MLCFCVASQQCEHSPFLGGVHHLCSYRPVWFATQLPEFIAQQAKRGIIRYLYLQPMAFEKLFSKQNVALLEEKKPEHYDHTIRTETRF